MEQIGTTTPRFRDNTKWMAEISRGGNITLHMQNIDPCCRFRDWTFGEYLGWMYAHEVVHHICPELSEIEVQVGTNTMCDVKFAGMYHLDPKVNRT